MHGSKAHGGNKLPPALLHLQVGLSQKISEVHTDHPTSTIPISPKPFTVIVIFYDTNEVYGLQFSSPSTGVKLGSKAPIGGARHHLFKAS